MQENVRRALVVDDSRTMAEIMSKLLGQLGFGKVEAVHSGNDALKIIAEQPFELMLCDFEMAPMCGKELTARVRADRRHDSMKIIMATANAARIAEEMSTASETMRADGYILKPFNAEKLKTKLNQLNWTTPSR